MNLREIFLPEFDQEMANTRRMLERVPENNLDFHPHAKSWPMSTLVAFIADLARWGELVLTQDSLDVAPPGRPPYSRLIMTSSQQILAVFDDAVKGAHAALSGLSDEDLTRPWSLQRSGQTLVTAPRYRILQTMILDHMIHHRAQLGVYFRLLNMPVPAIYGRTADEQQPLEDAFAA
jgi:uncharacterized damage-inducible protein DinB